MGTLVQLRALLFCAFFALVATGLGCNSDDETIVALKGDEKLSQGDPVPFLFYPVYPNPTEGIASVEFGIVRTMRVQFRIYTEDWQEIIQVCDRTFAPGMYMFHLNSKHELAHGVYYCVLEGEGYTEIQTMRVVK